MSLCLPTAFSILTNAFSQGRRRNIAFACIGLGQPLGFSVGLVLGGVVIDTPLSWRFAMYLCTGMIFALFVTSVWKLPYDKPERKHSHGVDLGRRSTGSVPCWPPRHSGFHPTCLRT